jgi:hypothetical protein
MQVETRQLQALLGHFLSDVILYRERILNQYLRTRRVQGYVLKGLLTNQVSRRD